MEGGGKPPRKRVEGTGCHAVSIGGCHSRPQLSPSRPHSRQTSHATDTCSQTMYTLWTLHLSHAVPRASHMPGTMHASSYTHLTHDAHNTCVEYSLCHKCLMSEAHPHAIQTPQAMKTSYPFILQLSFTPYMPSPLVHAIYSSHAIHTPCENHFVHARHTSHAIHTMCVNHTPHVINIFMPCTFHMLFTLHMPFTAHIPSTLHILCTLYTQSTLTCLLHLTCHSHCICHSHLTCRLHPTCCSHSTCHLHSTCYSYYSHFIYHSQHTCSAHTVMSLTF